jgi:hypothetical protein
MTMRILFIILLLIFISGCAVGIERRGYTQSEVNNAINLESCKIAVKYKENYNNSEVAKIIGTIRSYEQGFSINCSEIEVLSIFYKEACIQGADIINIVEEKHISFASTCYRATAELVKLKDRETTKCLESDPRYSLENLKNRAMIDEKEFRRQISAGILGGLFGGMMVLP